MPNKMEHFTQPATQALSNAQTIAAQMQHNRIYAAHLLLAFQQEGQTSIASNALTNLKLDTATLTDAIKEKYPIASNGTELDLSTDTKKTLEQAVVEARRRNDNAIRAHYLLLGTLITPDVIALLKQQAITPDAVRAQVDQLTTNGDQS